MSVTISFAWLAPVILALVAAYLVGWDRGFMNARGKAEHFALDNLERVIKTAKVYVRPSHTPKDPTS